ncbi:hypothetical protein [Bacteriovorax sp. Seq25_V]|uniref:hypothetical protein n=1 Tax=Bacteriovorax sp. Seq25_V TaxID=1201288 RepID=UPI00038A1F5B|nr:hypothetical protein [Bacteriovorax sp. Seq25_V]EQC47125.1 hypothetical protein M900_0922 [Bacteriovorax sp. Seq25_V]
MKTIFVGLILSLLSITSSAATKEQVFNWFESLQDQSYTLKGSEGCGEISISKVMYDFGAGPNTPMIVIKSEELGEEIHLAGSKFHDKNRSISADKYTFKMKGGCEGDFFNGMCETKFEITKSDDTVLSLKLIKKKSKFLLPVSKTVMNCSL